MKIAVMQPYLFPYIGYFQLFHATDELIIYDDVNYISRGWINRNRILINGNPYRFTIPVKKASQNKLIRNISMAVDDNWKRKFFRSLTLVYKNAPFFDSVFGIVKAVFTIPSNWLLDWYQVSIDEIFSYLDLTKHVQIASEIGTDEGLHGQERIIDLCKRLDADVYINPENGEKLYEQPVFHDNGIRLCFLYSHATPYEQFQYEFVPQLSIIDVLMFNNPETVRSMLADYVLN